MHTCPCWRSVLNPGRAATSPKGDKSPDRSSAWQGDVEKIRKLLSTSARVLANTVDENRRRYHSFPLQVACACGTDTSFGVCISMRAEMMNSATNCKSCCGAQWAPLCVRHWKSAMRSALYQSRSRFGPGRQGWCVHSTCIFSAVLEEAEASSGIAPALSTSSFSPKHHMWERQDGN